MRADLWRVTTLMILLSSCSGETESLFGIEAGNNDTNGLPPCANVPEARTGDTPPVELQGDWLFDDTAVGVSPNGTPQPNGSQQIRYGFFADGTFRYEDRMTMVSQQAPSTELCEQTLLNTTEGVVEF